MIVTLLPDLLGNPIAASIEPAAIRGINGIEHIPLNGLQVGFLLDMLFARYGCEEGRGVWVLRFTVYMEDMARRAIFLFRDISDVTKMPWAAN